MKESFRAKLEKVSERYEELSAYLATPEIINDQNKFRDYSKEYSELEPLIGEFNQYKKAENDLIAIREMMSDTDPEVKEMAKEEFAPLTQKIEQLDKNLILMLLPQDANDAKNILQYCLFILQDWPQFLHRKV